MVFSSVWQNSKKLRFWPSALYKLFSFLLMQNYLAFGQTLGSKLFPGLPTTCTDTIILMIIKFCQIIWPLALIKYSAFGCGQIIPPSVILYFKNCFTAACHLHCHHQWWSIILIIVPLVWTKLNISEFSPWLWPNYSAFGKGPIIEPLVSLWVQTCFTACQPLALAPSFWWSFPQCLRDRIHFLTPFLIGFSADV